MVIFPAIDIKGGKCVRLYQGNFDTAEQVAGDALETAQRFKSCGARWVHMVDLDGSLEGKRVNEGIFIRIAKESGLSVQLGGGIRDMETASYYIENGISRIILGTAAIDSPEFVREAVRKFGDKVAAGIDAKSGVAMARGWTEGSGTDFVELAKRMDGCGVKTLIYTDISLDGTLAGIGTEHYERLMKAVSCDIIASGGIKDINDISKLRALGLYGAICGKSLYSGSLDLKKAIKISV